MEALARRQDGVVSRAQTRAAGMSDKQVRWRLQRGDWRRMHPGVYLTHTGQVTWRARAWAALLWCGPGSVLLLEAAAHVWRLQQAPPRVITVGIPHRRAVRGRRDVRPVVRRRLSSVSVDGLPVTRLAQTVVDLADRPDHGLDEAVALAARACQRNGLDAQAIVAELGLRGRHRWRRELLLACGEIGAGAESLPEVWFGRRVLARHRLPVFERQVREAAGSRADLKSQRFGVNVEVDGRLWHAGDTFHTDRRRDREAAARGEVTVRVTYLDLDRSPCQVAADLAQVLWHRGWREHPRPCGPSCAVRRPASGV